MSISQILCYLCTEMYEGSIFLFTFRLFLRHTHKKKQMEETEFEHIVQEMRPRLTAHCQRYLSAGALAEEADDIVQETLVKLWKMRERLSEYQSIEALGMTIARNLCIDHLRRNKAQTASLEQMKHPAEICTATERTDQTIIGEDTQRRLNRAMDRLPSTQRRMLLLRSEGKSLDEIAEICGANKTSTKTMISAARRSLLKMMKS